MLVLVLIDPRMFMLYFVRMFSNVDAPCNFSWSLHLSCRYEKMVDCGIDFAASSDLAERSFSAITPSNAAACLFKLAHFCVPSVQPRALNGA